MRKDIATTYDIAMAVGRDAGNRAMIREKRHKWSEHDFEVACETFHRIFWSPTTIPERTHK